MNFTDLKVILQRLDMDTDLLIETSENQLSIPCVLAEWTHAGGSDSHPSLSIRYNDPEQPTLYNCFACHESGTIWQLVDSVASKRNDSELKLFAAKLCESDKPTLASRFLQLSTKVDNWYDQVANVETVTLSESVLDKFAPALSDERCRDYLRSRSVPRKAIEDFDIRFDARSSRVVFPVRNVESKLVGAVGRAIENINPRYWNYFGFAAGQTLGGVHRATNGSTVIIVEGFFDLLNCYQWMSELNASVVCTWSADISEQQGSMISALDKSIQFWYDQDTAGNRGYDSAMCLLSGEYNIKRARWPGDIDVGEMPKQKFVSIFKSLQGELRYGKTKASW